jgi:hypothetical protein
MGGGLIPSRRDGSNMAGVYVKLGEKLDALLIREASQAGRICPQSFSAKTIGSREARQPPARGATVELRQIDATHLEVIARRDDEVTARSVFDVQFEKASGAWLTHFQHSGSHRLRFARGA